MDANDIKFQIHCIETEAYGAVLRAFIAQSDVLTWDKEGLITELRKELNVTDIEHRELLVKVDSDNSVKMIRGWRKGTVREQESLSNRMRTPGLLPNSIGHVSHKRLKTSNAAVSSFPKYLSSAQPSSAAIISTKQTFFRGSQRGDEMVVLPDQGNAMQCMKPVGHNRLPSYVSRERGPLVVRTKKVRLPPEVDNITKRSDVIEICATDKLIREVEKVIYGVENPDPVQVNKAKMILKEHERAILEALDKLADVPDGDDSPDRLHQQYNHAEQQHCGLGMATSRALYGNVDRMNTYFNEGYGRDQTNRVGKPCMDVQDDEETP